MLVTTSYGRHRCSMSSIKVSTTLKKLKPSQLHNNLFYFIGNHESIYMNQMYGFEGEVKAKYPFLQVTCFNLHANSPKYCKHQEFFLQFKMNCFVQYSNSPLLLLCSINLLAYFHECRSLIGYATRYLFRQLSVHLLTKRQLLLRVFEVSVKRIQVNF